MLTIEKVIILKSVSIFSQVPENTLVEVAQAVVEREFPAQTIIFQQGDIGTTLYVIVSGKVKIHQGDQVITELGERQVFGELAALDPEPRSAAATTTEETLVFELDRDALYELLAEHVDVAQGVIRVLCQRLRQKK
jgi:CRP/FNR family transcriptional regulator, cyclic AMP receptor protein